jgi:hypothetical protein
MGSEPRFYLLEDDFGGPRDTHAEQADGTETGEAPRCPKCGRFIGMRTWLPPYRVEVEVHGKEGAGDLAMGTGTDLLVSKRLVDAFRAEGLTGLDGFHPVEVVKRNARAKRLGLPTYLLVRAAYGRAAVDEARSRLRRNRPLECDECRSPGNDGIYGFRLEAGTWDGLDAFHPRGLQGRVVASERFAEFVRRHGFTNIKLIPTEQFVWDPLRKGPPAEAARAESRSSDRQVTRRHRPPGG